MVNTPGHMGQRNRPHQPERRVLLIFLGCRKGGESDHRGQRQDDAKVLQVGNDQAVSGSAGAGAAISGLLRDQSVAASPMAAATESQTPGMALLWVTSIR